MSNPADASADASVASPCIGVCQLDRDSICSGCGRLIGEIAEWSRAGEQRRRQIARDAAARRGPIAPEPKTG